MDAPSSIAANLTRLGAASRKLQELLCDVLLLEEEVQDQVADDMRDAVQLRLLASR
jgi:hypothetical protein